ncbi:MAG: rhamnulokinase [Clostridia bacterium]|nr:rhamnulokinase [Clostridia bacterium]
MKKAYLAVDVGASSGRHIVGWMENGRLQTREVFRFPNGVRTENGHLTWVLEQMFDYVKEGIDLARNAYPELVSLSVDTWGVDYVLMREETPVTPCFAYRDGRTEAVIPDVHARIPFDELYRKTGIQFQPFNSIYQLYADFAAGRLDGATDFLMIPEYLMYRLCGTKVHEYTNATTTGLVSAETGEYDGSILSALGLPAHLFTPLRHPGEVIGTYEGLNVVLCATHDTGSAVEGIPMDENMPYISSGTWSLLGIKTPKPVTDDASREANWSNEGGVGYNRYQKNIMGMWLVNRLRDELCPDKPFSEITADAERDPFDGLVDADDPSFLAPASMKDAFDAALTVRPETDAGYFRCAYQSLADSYRKAVDELERNLGRTFGSLTIVGGGAKNGFLNELTEKATGKRVLAIPIEASAIGNLRVQCAADR